MLGLSVLAVLLGPLVVVPGTGGVSAFAWRLKISALAPIAAPTVTIAVRANAGQGL